MALLIVQFIRRKHRTLELSLFFQMCLTNLLAAVVTMAFAIAPLFFTANDAVFYIPIMLRYSVGYFVEQIFVVVLLAQWLLYIEYTLHQSRDLIRRRYRPAMIPFAVAVVVLIAGGIAEFALIASSVPIPIDPVLLDRLLLIVPHAVFLLYIVAGYVVFYREKKRNRIPAYIRLTPTMLCMIAGIVLNMLLPELALLPLFFAFGLLFADYFLYRRLNHIDPVTGFFNRSYLPWLIRFAKKKKLTGATLIRFQAAERGDDLAALLKTWAPTECKTIALGDGVFLLVSGPVKDSVAVRFIALLTEQAKSQGLPVEADYETDREAPLDELLRKY